MGWHLIYPPLYIDMYIPLYTYYISLCIAPHDCYVIYREVKQMNYNEMIAATWDMFPLSVGIEYALISMGKSTPIREQKVADAIGLGMNGGD